MLVQQIKAVAVVVLEGRVQVMAVPAVLALLKCGFQLMDTHLMLLARLLMYLLQL